MTAIVSPTLADCKYWVGECDKLLLSRRLRLDGHESDFEPDEDLASWIQTIWELRSPNDPPVVTRYRLIPAELDETIGVPPSTEAKLALRATKEQVASLTKTIRRAQESVSDLTTEELRAGETMLYQLLQDLRRFEGRE